jgi:hypothetical protein
MKIFTIIKVIKPSGVHDMSCEFGRLNYEMQVKPICCHLNLNKERWYLEFLLMLSLILTSHPLLDPSSRLSHVKTTPTPFDLKLQLSMKSI